ncbi:MAG: transposase, partial [Planctomycetes bacterium]|nr:transposase [Planctomycetota bacterium]
MRPSSSPPESAAAERLLRPLADYYRQLLQDCGGLGCDKTRVTLIMPPLVPPIDPLDPRSPRIHEVLTAAQAKGEKMSYLRNHWDALQLFVSDGRMPIDNNEVEQLMKQVALGRKKLAVPGQPGSRHAGRYAADDCQHRGPQRSRR